MIPGFHGFDLVIVLVIALLIFGPKKLPEMGSAIGKSINNFKKGMSEITSGKCEEEDSAKKLEAIEREIAAKKADAAAREAAQPEVDAEAKDSKVD